MSAVLDIRSGAPADLDLLYGLLVEMHAEVGISRLAPDKARGVIAHTLDTGVVFIAEHDGEMLGSIGCAVAQQWYSEDWFLGDFWAYVHPRARKTAAARMLLSAAREAAKLAHIPFIPGVFGTAQALGRKVKFYERLGFEPIAVMFKEAA